MSLLQVQDLRTWFEGEDAVSKAVDGVSFGVDEGETVGIVGESGCGKTVTSLSLMGLVPDPPGRIVEGSSIRLKGRELVGLSNREMSRIRGNEMAMIFQEPMSSLNPVYTVGDQIREVLRRHRQLTRREAGGIAVDLLGEVGIPEPERRFREYPHQLSGGMLQRVMIAMALSCEPGLLIADEPTTALDVTIQAQILDLLRRLGETRGMAVLLITHDLGVVAEVCDRVLVMYAGQLVETGPVEAIFSDPRHPYTQGLLNSLPGAEDGRTRLRPIAGTVPTPDRWPRGCRFRDRCPRAWERCAEAPPLLEVGGASSRRSRCWLEASAEDSSPPEANA
ncbi:MAG: ABC transporter ATP-binding protein [Gemmatimonadota bacterium]